MALDPRDDRSVAATFVVAGAVVLVVIALMWFLGWVG